MVGHTLRLIVAYIIKNNRQFIVGLVVGIIGVFAILKLAPIVAKNNRKIVIGLTGNYTVANLPISVQEKISFGLTKILPDGSATSAAAMSYKSTDSGKIYQFTLNNNLFWQDKLPFKPGDVNYNLADVKVTIPNDQSVQFELASSFSPLTTVVSQPLFKPGLIGLGEYKVKSVKSAGRFLQSIVLEKGEENILYKFYPTEPALKTAFKLGEVDTIIAENKTGLDEYIIEEKVNYSKQAVAFFNTRVGKTAEKSFRQGLIYALSEFSSFGEPSNGPVAPTSWAYNPNLKKYKTNIELAKKDLGDSSASESGGLRLTATLALRPVGEELKTYWEKAGLKINFETSDVIPENFEVYLAYVEIPVDPDQYSLWHSTSPINISQYKSPKSDILLEEGRQSVDQKVRKQIYFDWQKAITEDVPAAFLFFPKTYTISRN